MLIAFASNDRKTLAKRTGRAKEFVFYEIKNGKIDNIYYEENEHHHHHHHDENKKENHPHRYGRLRNEHGNHHHHHHNEDNHSHKQVVKQLKKVDKFYVKAVGKHMRADLTEGKIPFELVRETYIKEVLQNKKLINP